MWLVVVRSRERESDACLGECREMREQRARIGCRVVSVRSEVRQCSLRGVCVEVRWRLGHGSRRAVWRRFNRMWASVELDLRSPRDPRRDVYNENDNRV